MRKILTFAVWFLLLLPGYTWSQLPGECDYISGYPNSVSNWPQFWLRQVLASDAYIYEWSDTTDINWCHSVLNWGGLPPIAVNYHLIGTVKDSNNVTVLTYEYDGPDTVLSFGKFVRHQWSFDSTSTWQPGTYVMHIYLIDWPQDSLVLEFVIEQEIPVELISFTARLVGQRQWQSVVLEWQTATELNNAGWYVERSSNRRDWQRLDWIDGNGTTTIPHSYIYKDRSVQGSDIYYRLLQLDFNGSRQYSPTIQVQSVPDKYALSQNYPNPFNSQTKISYALSLPGKVDLRVYDILGNEVAVLVNEEQSAGVYTVDFSADRLASGMYVYALIVGEFRAVKRMVLMK